MNTVDIPWTNPRFVIYPDAYDDVRFAHIVTPDWVKRPDSLFQWNGDVLCGAGASRTKCDGIGYYRSGAQNAGDLTPQYYDAPPAGVRVCQQCLAHLEKEYLPFVEDE